MALTSAGFCLSCSWRAGMFAPVCDSALGALVPPSIWKTSTPRAKRTAPPRMSNVTQRRLGSFATGGRLRTRPRGAGGAAPRLADTLDWFLSRFWLKEFGPFLSLFDNILSATMIAWAISDSFLFLFWLWGCIRRKALPSVRFRRSIRIPLGPLHRLARLQGL